MSSSSDIPWRVQKLYNKFYSIFIEYSDFLKNKIDVNITLSDRYLDTLKSIIKWAFEFNKNYGVNRTTDGIRFILFNFELFIDETNKEIKRLTEAYKFCSTNLSKGIKSPTCNEKIKNDYKYLIKEIENVLSKMIGCVQDGTDTLIKIVKEHKEKNPLAYQTSEGLRIGKIIDDIEYKCLDMRFNKIFLN